VVLADGDRVVELLECLAEPPGLDVAGAEVVAHPDDGDRVTCPLGVGERLLVRMQVGAAIPGARLDQPVGHPRCTEGAVVAARAGRSHRLLGDPETGRGIALGPQHRCVPGEEPSPVDGVRIGIREGRLAVREGGRILAAVVVCRPQPPADCHRQHVAAGQDLVPQHGSPVEEVAAGAADQLVAVGKHQRASGVRRCRGAVVGAGSGHDTVHPERGNA
jgi:hypothetical protein